MSTCVMPSLRMMLLKARAKLNKNPGRVMAICNRFKLGDWFILYQLGKNIDPLIFREFIKDLYEQLEYNDKQRDAEMRTMAKS